MKYIVKFGIWYVVFYAIAIVLLYILSRAPMGPAY
jgi:hypothetical protein